MRHSILSTGVSCAIQRDLTAPTLIQNTIFEKSVEILISANIYKASSLCAGFRHIDAILAVTGLIITFYVRLECGPHQLASFCHYFSR